MKKDTKGFTLIELLLVIALFSLVMTATYKVFDSQQRSYIFQEEVAAMQQNIRPAMFLVAKEARMAGTYLGSENGWVESIKVHNNYAGGSFKAGADIIDIIYASFTTRSPLVPQNNLNYLPPESANTPVSEDFSMKAGKTDPCPPLNGDGEYQECFEEGQLIVISDGKNSNFLKITGVNYGSVMINHNPGNKSDDINIPAQKNWPNMDNTLPKDQQGYNVAGSYLMKIVYISFAIKETDTGLSLSFCPEVNPNNTIESRIYNPVAENIEDLQIALIMKDGREVYTANDNEDDLTDLNNFDTDTTNDTDDIRGIRITLVARSNRTFSEYSGKKPAIEDHAQGNSDGYIRRTYTTEVKLRNFGINE